jgi:hypothetical protein
MSIGSAACPKRSTELARSVSRIRRTARVAQARTAMSSGARLASSFAGGYEIARSPSM